MRESGKKQNTVGKALDAFPAVFLFDGGPCLHRFGRESDGEMAAATQNNDTKTFLIS